MYYQVAHVPGGQAIGALESWFAKIAKRLGRLFGRKQPRRGAEAAAPAEQALPDPIPAE
jgi:lipopolysaccharide export system permease protein